MMHLSRIEKRTTKEPLTTQLVEMKGSYCIWQISFHVLLIICYYVIVVRITVIWNMAITIENILYTGQAVVKKRANLLIPSMCLLERYHSARK